jgi:hypothetical protein
MQRKGFLLGLLALGLIAGCHVALWRGYTKSPNDQVSTGPTPLRLLVVYHRQLDPHAGSDRRLETVVGELLRNDGVAVGLALVSPTLSSIGCSLSELQHRISYINNASAKVPKLLQNTSAAGPMELYSFGRSLRSELQISCVGAAAVAQLVSERCFDVVLAPVWFWGGRLASLADQVLPPLRHHFDNIASTTALVALSDDAHSARAHLLAKSEPEVSERVRLVASVRRLANAEQRIYAASHRTLFASSEDLLATMTTLVGMRDVRTEESWYKKFALLRVGLRLNRGKALEQQGGFHSRWGVIFVGSGGVTTNYQGIHWFLTNCWAQLLQRIPRITLTIVGSLPSEFQM